MYRSKPCSNNVTVSEEKRSMVCLMSCENYDPCFPDQLVVDLYLPVWASQPAFSSKPAFVWAEDSPISTTWSCITYSHLNSSVQAIASSLLFPLQRGDTVLILCPPGLHLVKTIFSCQRAGLVAIPIIPPNHSEFSSPETTPACHHLLRVLAQTNPKAAIAHHRYISAVTTSIAAKSSSDRLHKLLMNLRWLSVENLDVEPQEASRMASNFSDHYSGCRPEEPYLVQYTSGATGIPKPVIVTAGAAAHNVRAARRAYDLQPSSMIISWLPQYHDCGLMFLLLTIVSGATCVLASPSAFLTRPRLWLELITEFKATCTPVPSFALPLVAKRGGIDKGKLPLKLESLRNLILINEPIYKSSVQEFVDEFVHVGLNPSSISPSYGLAENCTFVSTAWQCSSSESSSCFPNMPSYKKLLPSARLAASPSSENEEDIRIIVVNDETCEPVEDGVEGEIWVSSASNASSYLGHPSLTNAVFYARLRGVAGPCFVRTGDRGVVKGEERYLYVLGRTSDIIRVSSHETVHSHYLETAAYNSNPTHLRGGCVAAFGVAGTVAVVAELQKQGGARGTGKNSYYNKICEGIRANVMKEEGVIVGMVVLVEGGSVPKTTSGKLRRFLAKDMLLKGRLPVVCEVRFEEFSVPENDEVSRREARDASIEGDHALSFTGASHRPSLRSFL